MALVRLPAAALGFALVLAACSSAADPAPGVGTADRIVVPNQGGALEGHTPRGFAGMGTGLFAGDNLNAGFPDGDGVQIYLTFEIPAPGAGLASAVLASDALVVNGSPFDDLGLLVAEVVAYDSFGPDLFDLPSASQPVVCTRVGETGIECDVSDLIWPALDDRATILQFRLKFERAGDGDGRADLAMFYRTDSNTNEPGLFTLTIEG